MRQTLVVAVLVFCGASLCAAQKPAETAAQNSAAPPAAPQKEVQVPAGAPVVKISGLCEQAVPGKECQTVITKAEFDRLIQAVNPKISDEQKRELATLYVQLLVMAHEGEKIGAEKDPTFQERLHLERLKMLAEAAERHYRETTEPTSPQVDVFYAENSQMFQDMHLQRITIPKTVNGEFNDAAAKELANKIRARATEGESMALMQAEVWSTEKATGAPPNPDLGWKRRGTVDQRYEQQLLGLKLNEVSPVLQDAQNFYVYKLAEKRLVPIDQVRKDIANALQQQNFTTKVKGLLDSVKTDLNESYFGAEPPSKASEKGPAAEKPAAPPH